MTKMLEGAIESAYVGIFGAIATRAGKHWELSDKEAKKLGSTTEAVIEKWLPIVALYGAELALGMALFAVLMPRIQYQRLLSGVAAQVAQRGIDPRTPEGRATVNAIAKAIAAGEPPPSFEAGPVPPPAAAEKRQKVANPPAQEPAASTVAELVTELAD